MTKEEFLALRGEPDWIPCRGQCGAQVFMAKHERTNKPAPLLRPKEGGPKPNIVAWQGADGWQYRIVKEGGEFLNHFADCPMARRFRRPVGDK